MNVEAALQQSPVRLITARPDTTIIEAARRLGQFNVGIVVVVDDDGRVAGVLSERDIAIGLGNLASCIEDAVVGDLMTDNVVSISPEGSLVDAVLDMNDHGVRHLVVVEGNRPTGVLSIRDVLRVFALQYLDDEIDVDAEFTTEFAKAVAAA